MRIDLYSLARGRIVTQKRVGKLTKKQKAHHDFNNQTLGFDRGFTKKLLRRLARLRNFIADSHKKSERLIIHKGDLRKKKPKHGKKKTQ